MLLTIENWRAVEDSVIISTRTILTSRPLDFILSLTNPEHISHIKRWHDECRGENSCFGKVLKQLLDELVGEQVFLEPEE